MLAVVVVVLLSDRAATSSAHKAINMPALAHSVKHVASDGFAATVAHIKLGVRQINGGRRITVGSLLGRRAHWAGLDRFPVQRRGTWQVDYGPAWCLDRTRSGRRGRDGGGTDVTCLRQGLGGLGTVGLALLLLLLAILLVLLVLLVLFLFLLLLVLLVFHVQGEARGKLLARRLQRQEKGSVAGRTVRGVRQG